MLLMLNSIDLTNDEAHSLAGVRLPIGFASLALRTMMSASSLGAALAVLARYFETCSGVFRLSIDRSGGLLRIGLSATDARDERVVLLEEIWMGAVYMFLCWFAGANVPIVASTPSRLSHLGANRFGWRDFARDAQAAHCSLTLPLHCATWKRSVSEVEEPMWEALREWLDSSRGDAEPFERSGALMLDDLEKLANAPLKQAFKIRAMSDRQLSRVIRRHYGASFRELRADAIVDKATVLLTRTNLPIADVAAELGYSDMRSFRRFFQSHAKVSPYALRKGHDGRMPSTIARTAPPLEGRVRARIHALTRKMDL